MKPKRSARRKRRSDNTTKGMRGGDGEMLSPLMEGPTPQAYYYCTQGDDGGNDRRSESPWGNMRHWVKGQLEKSSLPSWVHSYNYSKNSAHKRCDPRLLLGVLGCPLAPIAASNPSANDPFLSIKGLPIETSSAKYIVQQYIAATGGLKLQSSIQNSYTMGRIRMLTSEFETATRVIKKPVRPAENGWFVLWQMMPDKWHVELEIEDTAVQAGSNGKVLWRYTPWLGAHAANGPTRPLRRALQGVDPITTANLFINAKCIGEKKIGEEDCFVLKLAADPQTLTLRSEGPAEIIRHVLIGYFSQRTGLLMFLEDSHLTRIQANGVTEEAVYWETTIESSLQDFRYVDGINIAHAGHSVVTLFRFGEEAMSHTKTKMEEVWAIEEVAFNVAGVSSECFIPPSEIGKTHLNRAKKKSEKATRT